MQSTDTPQRIAIPFARDGDKRTIPDSSLIGVINGAASFPDGFPPLTFIDKEEGGIPPAGKDFNGILYQMSIVERFLCAGGRFKYDAAFSTAVGGYPKGAELLKADASGVWQNTVENNTSNPDTGGAGWITGAASAMYLPPGSSGIPTTVQNELRRQVWLDNYPSLGAAIADLAMTGGVINLSNKAYPPENWKFDTRYMATPNITLRGVKMPRVSDNCDRLVGGSIIQGRLNVFADNFAIENIGFDLGKYVVDTYFGGVDTHSANYPYGDGWDAFAFAQPSQGTPLRGRFNFYANNVIGLSRDSESFGHSILIEGVNGGYVNNVIGVGGVHALVFKSKNITGGYVAGYCASSDNVIIKSDTYAACGDIRLATVHAGGVPPGITPWYTPAVAQWGLLLNPSTDDLGPVHIGALNCVYSRELIASAGSATPEGEPLFSISGFKVENAECDGVGIVGGAGLALRLAKFFRPIIDTLVVNNCDFPVTYDQRASAGGADSFPLSINNLVIGGTCNNSAIQAFNFGQIVADSFTYYATGAIGLYDIDATARVSIGNNLLRGAYGVVFIRNAPTLTTGWSSSAGSPFRVTLANYGVAVHGLLSPGVGATGTICTLPEYLRTKFAVRLSTVGKDAVSVIKPLFLNVDPTYGFLGLNDGGPAVTGAESYVSLDGVTWGFN